MLAERFLLTRKEATTEAGIEIPACGDRCNSRMFAHCFQEWGGGAIQPREYDQMEERLHHWVLRDSCLRRNDGGGAGMTESCWRFLL